MVHEFNFRGFYFRYKYPNFYCVLPVSCSRAGSVKSQIFVKTSDSPDKVVSIDHLSTGNNLMNVLKEELKEDITNYNVTFGTKKVGTKSAICIFEMW